MSRNRLCWAGGLITLYLISLGGPLNGQEPAPPDKLTIDYHRGRRAPMAIPGYDNYHAYLVDSVDLKGRSWHRQVRVSSPWHGSTAFPALRKGEVIPMFGALYRVQSDVPLEVVRLQADEVPKGVAVETGSVTIPVRRDNSGSGQVVFPTAPGKADWRTVFVTAIRATDPGAGPVAEVKVNDIRKESQAIRKGDVLKLGESEWTVRAVVPPGGKQHLFGWVELGRRETRPGR